MNDFTSTNAAPAVHDAPELIGFTLTHSMLRVELSILTRFELGVGDQAVFADHLRLVTDHLARHDQEEDEFHFRLLRERAPEVTALLDRLAADHVLVTRWLGRLRDPALALAQQLAVLRDLTELVLHHMEEEDEHIVPLLALHITAEEQAGSMARSRSKIPPEDELRVLACMLGAADDEERARMLAPLPAAVEELWRTTAGPDLDAVHAALTAAHETSP